MEQIMSRENAKIKQVVKLLSQKKERRETGFFVAEGMKLCCEAALSGIEIVRLFCTESAQQRYADRFDLLVQKAGECCEISEELAARIFDTNTPQGIACICRIPAPTLLEQNIPTGYYIALESLQDPGNLGTIIRTADAFGINGVIMTENCPELFSPKVLRATMGSAFRVPVCITGDLPGLLRSLQQTHHTYAAALCDGAQSIRHCNLANSAVVVVGNEGNGLTEKTIAACESTLKIDMPGTAESLNAGVAASIIMWEMAGA